MAMANPSDSAAAGDLHRVDADDLAASIQQRPAAVAGIDRGVGLQHHRRTGASDGADDARA